MIGESPNRNGILSGLAPTVGPPPVGLEQHMVVRCAKRGYNSSIFFCQPGVVKKSEEVSVTCLDVR